MILALLIACGSPDTEAPADTGCALLTAFADADSDGFGDPFVAVEACAVPEGHVEDATDCDDTDAAEHPGATWHADADGDDFGDAGTALSTCARPLGYVEDATDCDDADATRHPGAVWFTDSDGDGFGGGGSVDACGDVSGAAPTDTDCDDDDSDIHPDADEICDTIDNDCDALIDDDDPGVDPYTFSPLWVDADGDGFGSTESFGAGCADVAGGVIAQGDCDDDAGHVFPGQTDHADDLDADCDGEAFYQYVAFTAVELAGDTIDADFGYHVSAADIDGDGLVELLTGMEEADKEAGLVVLSASADTLTGMLAEDAPRWTGEAAGDLAGHAAVIAGDITGSGTADVLVGAYGASELGGSVYLLSTDADSGSLSEATARWDLTDHAGQLGEALLALGDADGDGHADALLAAPEYSGHKTQVGAVFLLQGGALSGSQDLKSLPVIEGIDGYDELGESLDLIGDIDGDGLDELLLGAPKAEADGGDSEGEAYVVALSAVLDGSVDLSTAETWRGIAADDHAGERVSRTGDVNGDGYADAIIGAPDADPSGEVYLILGSASRPGDVSLSQADATFFGDGEKEYAGQTLSAAGDANGDGLADFAIAATSARQGSTTGESDTSNVGQVYLILGGSLSGTHDLESDADVILQGDKSSDRVGRSMAAAGDVDGDGLDDLWVGATGVADDAGAFYLLSGAALP